MKAVRLGILLKTDHFNGTNKCREGKIPDLSQADTSYY